jgi:hypothetical protein
VIQVTADCPFCGKTIRRLSASVTSEFVPGEAANFFFNWRIKHDEPLCQKWRDKLVTAEDLFEAFGGEIEAE